MVSNTGSSHYQATCTTIITIYHARNGFSVGQLLLKLGLQTQLPTADTILSSIFSLLWISMLVFLSYKILRSCLRSRNSGPSTGYNRGSGSTPNYGGPGGWFPGTDEPQAPPPPYTKNPSNASDTWQPGFWTGTALGAAGTYLMNRNNERRRSPPLPRARWDWERSATSSRPSSEFDNTDRGEGSSNLGAMRSSTGFGGSRVR